MNWGGWYRALLRALDGTTGRNRRSLAKAREIAANDHACRRSVELAGGHAGIVVAAEAEWARAKAEPERYIRILPSTGRGVSLMAFGPGQSVVVDLREPGAWIGWGKDGHLHTFLDAPAEVGVDGLPQGFEYVDRELPSAPRMGAAWWAGRWERRLIGLTPGTVINFWPGRVEVVGP